MNTRLFAFIKRINIARLTNLVILLVVLWSMSNLQDYKRDKKVIVWDVIDYYAYLPATLIYHDLTLQFTKENPAYFSDKIWGHQLRDSKNKVIKMTMGMSLLYAPFFLIAHFVAGLLPVEANGFTWPYKLSLLLSSVFYLVLGLYLLRKLLSRYFNPVVTSITLLAVFAGTNLYYYAIYEAPMSHVYNFTLFIAFIHATLKWHESSTFKNSIIIGFLTGIISLIRPSNIIILIFFIFYGVTSFVEFRKRIHYFFIKSHLIFIMVLAFLLVWFPQLIYWKSITGHWFYYSYGDEGFFFSHPQIINGLFSYRKGWLVYTPLMSIALFGLVSVWKNHRKFFWPILLFISLNIYIIFSWWTWWYGGSFGQRPMIDSYGMLAIPFAAFTHYVMKSRAWIKFSILSVMLLLVCYSVFQANQYHYGAIHWDSMSKAAYWDSFLKLKPSDRFNHLIEEPDYEMAKKGIYVTKKEIPPNNQKQNKEALTKGRVKIRTIKCGAEHENTDGSLLTGNDSVSTFGSSSLRTTKYAFSGKYSIRLDNKHPFGFTHKIVVDSIMKVLQIKVRRHGSNQGYLVISNVNPDKYYLATNNSGSKDKNDWEQLELTLKIPAKTDTLICYTWNKGNKNIYFDDFTVSVFSTVQKNE